MLGGHVIGSEYGGAYWCHPMVRVVARNDMRLTGEVPTARAFYIPLCDAWGRERWRVLRRYPVAGERVLVAVCRGRTVEGTIFHAGYIRGSEWLFVINKGLGATGRGGCSMTLFYS